jgi:hypothetical protein
VFEPVQPSLMFVYKVGALPSKAPLRCSTLGWAPSLTHEHLTRLEKLARDKHSNLSQAFVNYDRKKFYNILPRSLKSVDCFNRFGSLPKIADLIKLFRRNLRRKNGVITLRFAGGYANICAH